MLAGVRSEMLVLHIDIDFFVDPIVYFRSDVGPRPSGREFVADVAGDVTDFAETQCLLDLARPLPGAAVIHNDGVFGEIERLVADGTLTAPFELVHVDAHADLGVGQHDRSFERISTELLHRPIAERPRYARDGLGALAFGNWLAFSLACRWIDKLTIVRHPRAGDDLHQGYFKEYVQPGWQHPPAQRELSLRMQPLTQHEHDTGAWLRTGGWGRVLERPVEAPLIPTTIIDRAGLQLDRAPDVLFLCQSPGYSPPSADRIFRGLKRYLVAEARRSV